MSMDIINGYIVFFDDKSAHYTDEHGYLHDFVPGEGMTALEKAKAHSSPGI